MVECGLPRPGGPVIYRPPPVVVRTEGVFPNWDGAAVLEEHRGEHRDRLEPVRFGEREVDHVAAAVEDYVVGGRGGFGDDRGGARVEGLIEASPVAHGRGLDIGVYSATSGCGGRIP